MGPDGYRTTVSPLATLVPFPDSNPHPISLPGTRRATVVARRFGIEKWALTDIEPMPDDHLALLGAATGRVRITAIFLASRSENGPWRIRTTDHAVMSRALSPD